ncbi:L-ribulose-5-phosphate 3-epimerase [Paucilactobacillus nenjiangensis]|jgi:hexulose-6-phosphate isomerase|uniref:L-ribulose-5-phosphate 3-epimerase n=1 Tax=Paucilactobacillus nenjiangensis TaxID=1296540 RepID=A0A5P1X0X0_9LACO|nr:L-ribulose-5-phosphate 3-epimerase [Paucilactobacillus nenjiangensis]QER66534.1 L-ribulose-5-phosphate 3-epimerase [Paucilactobacillus nenjiangensis]
MVKIGINEKSLPFELSWFDKLNCAKSCGYSFIELSIDETEDRISRLDWTKGQRLSLVEDVITTGVPIDTMMLSALRKFPLGSANAEIYDKSYEICQKAIILAKDLGIRNIQIAGYDEYYAAKSLLTRENFIENLRRVVNFASENQVMIAIETMDDKFINSIAKIREIKQEISSPWLQAYPDLGNISAWPENIPSLDLAEGLENIVSVHVKDTLSVTSTSPGKFKNVPFGEGDVEFFGLFKTLKRIGYSGTLTVEMWSEKNDNAVDLMIKAHTFVTELLSKAGLNIEN